MENKFTGDRKEKVLVVGIDQSSLQFSIESSMAELKELVKAAGGEVVAEVVQKLPKLNPKYLIGSGKVREIKDYCINEDVDTVVFNEELTGVQNRNLEDALDRKIIDRTNLILDIFALRATTREGMLQVKLAQLNYSLTRLIGSRNLSRLGGGIGTRGPGEQKLETDRRHILREIHSIKKQLKDIEKNRGTMRKRRLSENVPLVSLVGYTNAGKSTILNKLLRMSTQEHKGSEVFVKDMLFATLDPSMRRTKLPNGTEIIVSDTVGFVSKLPTKLVEAFKSTLEEIKYADLILHVIDGSGEDIELQYSTTMEILKDLDILSKPMITVFNKSDLVNREDLLFIPEKDVPTVLVSAKTGQNFETLIGEIETLLEKDRIPVSLSIPYSDSAIVDEILRKYKVDSIKYENEGTFMELNLDNSDFNKYKKYSIGGSNV